jgi:ABC-type transporter Mla subunit MlaD
VDKNAVVYRDAHTRLMQLGLLGDMAIDITQGTEAAGRAHDGDMFAGERTPDFSEAASKMLEVIKPVATEATSTMKELEATAQNLNKITDEGSELNQALVQFKTFGAHLVDITAPEGPLNNSLKNIEKISGSLSQNNNIEVTLQNFRESSEKLKSTMRDLEPVGQNIAEFSNTIKTQPWRLLWPGTKKSPEKAPTPAPAETTITVRKSTKAKPTATPLPEARGGR